MFILIKLLIRMQKEYRKMYFDLTRYNPLPQNCIPLTPKGKKHNQLSKLLEINKSILDIMDPHTSTFFHHKRVSETSIPNAEKQMKSQRIYSKRIHDNIAQIKSNKYMFSEVKQRNTIQPATKRSLQLYATEQNSKIISENSKDLYDVHIEKYMTTKYNEAEIIDSYLHNREQFIKKACKDIENEINQQVIPQKKQHSRIRLKHYQSKLPKIEEFSNRMLQKSTKKIRDGTFQKELNHLQKASQLQIKERKRKQRVFRRKINSLQVRLDKLKYADQM